MNGVDSGPEMFSIKQVLQLGVTVKITHFYSQQLYDELNSAQQVICRADSSKCEEGVWLWDLRPDRFETGPTVSFCAGVEI